MFSLTSPSSPAGHTSSVSFRVVQLVESNVTSPAKQGSKELALNHSEPFVDHFCGFRSELYGAFYEMTGAPTHRGRTTQDTGQVFVHLQPITDHTNKQLSDLRLET